MAVGGWLIAVGGGSLVGDGGGSGVCVRVLVGLGVEVGLVFVGCGVLLGRGVDVFAGRRVFVGRGVGVGSFLWQSGSARSIMRSPSSSVVL